VGASVVNEVTLIGDTAFQVLKPERRTRIERPIAAF